MKKISGKWQRRAEIFYHVAAACALIYGAVVVDSLVTKDKQVDIAQKMRVDRIELYKEAANLMTRRMYDQQRLVWKIKDTPDAAENVEKKKELDEMFNNYMESVREYNINVRILMNQIKHIFNENLSETFCSDDSRVTPNITASFVKIHRKILKLRENSWSRLNKNFVNDVVNESDEVFLKVDKYLKEMADITFSKDEDLKKHAI
ncbi:MAG: hypothetical protein K2J64_03210 [Desulfovibrio sp.]|nr:hypothetical protein [Desulfovibrio sp.]